MAYWQHHWLPSGYLDRQEENARFEATVSGLRSTADSCKQQAQEGVPNAWQGVLQWIPILNNQTDIQDDGYELGSVITCINTLQEVVLATSDDIEVQARAAQALTALLLDHKRQLSRRGEEEGKLPEHEPPPSDKLLLRVDWRPWLDLLLGLMDNPPPRVEGFALTSTRASALQKLVAALRRYFVPEAAFEIWALLSPAILSVSHDPSTAYDALGWASLFTPTYCISSCEPGALNQMVQAWIDAWGRMANSPPWNALFLSMLSRAAKHDYKGVIDWTPHLDTLFTHFIGAFDVPVGAASSMQPTLRSAPMKAMMHHAYNMTGVHSHGASILASLLRVRAVDERARDRVQQVVSRLRHMCSLIYNYFHPSNTGKWCRELSLWTRSLVESFIFQIGRQGASPPPWYSAIEPQTMTAFVACLAPLAARGQFSKDDGLSSACVYTLSSFAYVDPKAVLPLVVSRFRTAVVSQTATHQLVATITCLSKSVRALLLSGWGLESDGESGEQLLAEAMMALLPGIDANDEQKTMAVMQFYTTVLSSLPVLMPTGDEAAQTSGAVCLPLYFEEFGEEVLGRLLTLLGGMDSGLGHRADAAAGRGGSVSSHAAGGVGGGSSFLTLPGSFFPHLASLLFSRMPSEVGANLAKKAARFAASELLPGVEQAMGVLLFAAAEHHPEVAWKEGLRPLMLRIMAELQPHAAPGHPPPSPSLEATLCYQLGLLRQGVFAGTAHPMLPHVKQLMDVVDAALAVPSRPIQNAGSALLSSICCVCVRFYTTPDLLELDGKASTATDPRLALLGPHGIEQWVDKHGNDCVRPRWILPPPEAIALAEQLITSHLLAPLPRLLTHLNSPKTNNHDSQRQQQAGGSASETGHSQRLLLHGELVKMKGVLGGLLATLRDFDFLGEQQGSRGHRHINVLGNTGIAVGAVGTREKIAEGLNAAAPAMLGLSDSECISEFLVLCGLLASAGSLEHTGAAAMTLDTRKLMKKVEQPAVANLLLLQRGGPAAEVARTQPWRKQVPRWVAIAKLDQTLAHRAALSSYRPFSTAASPEVTDINVLPPSYRTLASMLCKFATHPLTMVRSETLTIMDAITKRFPLSIARACLPHFLCALADVSPPPELAPHSTQATDPKAEATMLERLSAACAATDGATNGDASQLGAQTPEGKKEETSQVEKDGRALGACTGLSTCLAFLRLIFRDATLLASSLHALMASRTHTSTQAQGAVSNLMIGFCSRFVRPATLAPGTPMSDRLAAHMLHLAQPDTLRATWRYSLSANVICLMLLPTPSSGEPVMPFARHALVLLATSNMIQLKQLAAGMLLLLLGQMVEFGESNPQLVSEIAAWLRGPGGSSLADHLAADHQTLEATEANQDKRGGGLAAMQARLLNMTHDELILKVVAASMDRMNRWPEGGHSEKQPQAVRDGLFVVPHARLIRLLATVAPKDTQEALRPALEHAARNASSQQVAAYTSEKAVQAAAAEATAGLLASGAPWAPESGSTSDAAAGQGQENWLVQASALQLQTMSLELSESWSLSMRYGVYGLINMVRPSQQLSRLVRSSPTPRPRTPPTLPPQQAEMALGTILGLARSMGPPLVTDKHDKPHAGSSILTPTSPHAPPPAAPGAADASSGTNGVVGVGVGDSKTSGGSVLNSGPGQLKRLRVLHQCARELISLDLRDARGLPQAVQAYWAALLMELRAAVHYDVFNLRQQLAKTLAMCLSYLGGAPSVSSGATSHIPAGGGLQAAQALAAARAGQAAAAAATAAAAGSGLQAVQALRSSETGQGERAKAGSGPAGVEALQGAARALAADFLAALASATTVVRLLKFAGTSQAKSTGGNPSTSDGMQAEGPGAIATGGNVGSPEAAPTAANTSGTPQHVSDSDAAVAVSQVGLASGVVSWGVLHGDLITMRPLLLRCLPHLLRLQELAGPTTQNVAHEAALALAMLKYVPLGSGEEAGLATGALQGAATPATATAATAAAAASSAASTAANTAASTAAATAAAAAGAHYEVEAAAVAAAQSAAAASQAAAAAGGELWSARAASLSYAQSFWFRNCFLISRHAIKRLEEVVRSRLSDAKPEVRTVAGATLSGMVRGMPEQEADSLRAQLIASARTLLKPSPKTAQAPSSGEAGMQAQQQALLEKHGLVQGLKAFLLSSPYDCPPWMPGVLMTLARFASSGQEASLKSSAAKALSEFKRTHEADSLDVLKSMMDPDEWDSLQQVTSPASYFT